MASILSIGQTALAAAQAGLATTGHNVANASTPGYNRQQVVQGALPGQSNGFGYIGNGTQIETVKRVFDEFLNHQVVAAQSNKGRLDAYYSQVKRLDSLVADPQTGVSPALHQFFKGVQNITADPSGAASREAMLSSATGLVGSFHTLDNYLSEMSAGVNSELSTSLTTINAYAKQLAKLNDAIGKAMGSLGSKPANDLLDQRDQLINDLSKEIKVSVVKQGNSYNVFIGNGQPLVMGLKTFDLVSMAHPTEPHRLQVGYSVNGAPQLLPESTMSGGRLGGLLEFRSQSLDVTQNALGRMAIGLATTFNAQHRLGITQTGAMGGDFFNIDLSTSAHLNGVDATATITDVSQLTTSDYRLQYDGANYNVTRLSDGKISTFATLPQAVDGVAFTVSGTPEAGDYFLLRPMAEAVSSFKVAIANPADIAVAAPIVTGAPLANSGTATISPGSVNSAFTMATVTPTVTLTYDATAGEFTGFPDVPVTVTTLDGTTTTYAAGAPVPYTSDAAISFGGVEVAISGVPAEGDRFTIGENVKHEGDSRNAILLGTLQEKTILNNGTATYQGAYAQMVSTIGNLTREVQVTSAAADKLHSQTVEAQQSMSGVNLDEEAANLMRYQQAYQAAGKIMQTASRMFDSLLEIGR
jgi:flagellar hook-associated protein 1 FlgK